MSGQPDGMPATVLGREEDLLDMSVDSLDQSMDGHEEEKGLLALKRRKSSSLQKIALGNNFQKEEEEEEEEEENIEEVINFLNNTYVTEVKDKNRYQAGGVQKHHEEYLKKTYNYDPFYRSFASEFVQPRLAKEEGEEEEREEDVRLNDVSFVDGIDVQSLMEGKKTVTRFSAAAAVADDFVQKDSLVGSSWGLHAEKASSGVPEGSVIEESRDFPGVVKSLKTTQTAAYFFQPPHDNSGSGGVEDEEVAVIYKVNQTGKPGFEYDEFGFEKPIGWRKGNERLGNAICAEDEHAILKSWKYFITNTLQKEYINQVSYEDIHANCFVEAEFRRLVRHVGVPHHYRKHIWQLSCSVTKTQEESNMLSYEKIVKDAKRALSNSISITGEDETESRSSSRCAVLFDDNFQWVKECREIENDLLRTMPNNIFFKYSTSSGVPKLRRVLRAVCFSLPEIGYCQGMGLIAASLLLVMEEEEAFWMMITIIRDIMPPNYYSKNLIGARADQRAFVEGVLKYCMFDVYEKLTGFQVELPLITLNWFITIYSGVVSMRHQMRIWDLLLNEGADVLFGIALSLLTIYKEDILSLNDAGDIFYCITSLPSRPINCEFLLRTCFEILDHKLPLSFITQQRKIFTQRLVEEEKEHHKKKRATRTTTKKKKQATKSKWKFGVLPWLSSTLNNFKGKRGLIQHPFYEQNANFNDSQPNLLASTLENEKGTTTTTTTATTASQKKKHKNIIQSEKLLNLRRSILAIVHHFEQDDACKTLLDSFDVETGFLKMAMKLYTKKEKKQKKVTPVIHMQDCSHQVNEQNLSNLDFSSFSTGLTNRANSEASISTLCSDSTSLHQTVTNAPVIGRCKAVWNFYRRADDELPFRKNDIINIISMDDEDCWLGELKGQYGFFPAQFVQILDEQHKVYNSLGDDTVCMEIHHLVRKQLCVALQTIFEYGFRPAAPLHSSKRSNAGVISSLFHSYHPPFSVHQQNKRNFFTAPLSIFYSAEAGHTDLVFEHLKGKPHFWDFIEEVCKYEVDGTNVSHSGGDNDMHEHHRNKAYSHLLLYTTFSNVAFDEKLRSHDNRQSKPERATDDTTFKLTPAESLYLAVREINMSHNEWFECHVVSKAKLRHKQQQERDGHNPVLMAEQEATIRRELQQLNHELKNTKFRALVCMGLNQQQLHNWFEVISKPQPFTDYWYDSVHSFINTPARIQIMFDLELLSKCSLNLTVDWELYVDWSQRVHDKDPPKDNEQIKAHQRRTGLTLKANDEAPSNKRVRTVEHVEGNWATLVYIELAPTEDLKEFIRDYTDAIGNYYPQRRSGGWELIPPSQLHVSLSKTLYLKYHQLDSFKGLLAKELSAVKSPFQLCVKEQHHPAEPNLVEFYSNEENTRHFMGLRILKNHPSSSPLLHLVQCVDHVCEEYSQPTFYPNPEFHASFAWTVDERLKEEAWVFEREHRCNQKSHWFHCPELDDKQVFYIDSIKIKMGNSVTELRL
eukprot:Nk52_evm28s1524 gene=Nk52_evmTU28s1524